MKRILVVDDSATVRKYHRSLLEQAGLLVDDAVNGVEAIERTLSAEYALLVVDVNMPRLDGLGLLRQLRQQDAPQAPTLMVTTEHNEEIRARAFAVGANDFMVKPVKPAEFLLRVKVLIGAVT